MIRKRDHSDGVLAFYDLIPSNDRRELFCTRRSGPINNLGFLFTTWVIDYHVEQKSISLCFRKRISSLLLDRILRRQNEEGFVEPVSGPPNRHFMLLHGLQQCRLGLWRRSVNFIGKEHLRKDRPLIKHQITMTCLAILLDDIGTRNVRWHQVRCELDPLKRQIHRFGQRTYHERLGETGHTFKQTVATSKNGNQQLLNDLVLANNNL